MGRLLRLTVLLAVVASGGLGGGYSDGTCPATRHVLALGAFPATVYAVWYDAAGLPQDPSGTFLYLESGARAGLQQGGDEVLLGPTYGHEYHCAWPVAAERDIFLY